MSLQRIHRAVETLRNLGSREHLSRYRLVADGGSVVWVTEDDAENPAAGVDLVLRPGQGVLVRLGDVLSPFTNAAGVQVPDFTNPRPKVQVDADVLAGYPVVAGTRVPFDLVAGLVAGGIPVERVGHYYPGVGAAAAAQAADYAAYVDQVAHRQAA